MTKLDLTELLAGLMDDALIVTLDEHSQKVVPAKARLMLYDGRAALFIERLSWTERGGDV